MTLAQTHSTVSQNQKINYRKNKVLYYILYKILYIYIYIYIYIIYI